MSTDEIKAIVDEEDLIDPVLMQEARSMVVGMFENMGVNLQQPQQPDPNTLARFDQQVQQAMLQDFQDELQLHQSINSQIDTIASQIAEEMLFDEIEKAHKGKLGIKVSMSPMAESMRVVKFLETMELHKALIESQQPGISRNRLIEAADPPNKEAILAEGVPAMAGGVA